MQVVTCVLSLGIVLFVFVVNDVRNLKQKKLNNVVSLAHIIAKNSTSTLEFRDDEAAKDILQNLHNVSPEILYAAIIDSTGKIFADYGVPSRRATHIDSFSALESSEFIDKHLLVTTAMISNNVSIGRVILDVDSSDLQEMKRSKFTTAGLLLLFAIGLSLIIAILMQTTITRRLAKLVGTMKEVGNTYDYNKTIADDGKDEISVLIQGFNQFMQQIAITQQKKDEFIGIASHELKTPITTIKGYLDLLGTVETDPTKVQFIQKASRNVERLEQLILDLLDVSKIQGGHLELNIQEFNLEELIKESITAMELLSSSHKILREGGTVDAFISADRQRIEQVIINILSNAIKYSPGEDRIIVRTTINETEVCIKIRDFGIGIPPGEQTQIFERFYRTKDSSIHISGFGLGLYICKDIIHRHGGRIWVDTEEKGSTFCFTLPILPSENKNEQ